MKNFYLVVQIKEDEKYYAYIMKTNSHNNLLSELKIKNAISVNIAPTKAQAYEWVDNWRTNWKKQGKYLFDEILF